MRLIAISGKRRSGKSTLANILQQDYGFTPVSLATPLKAKCMSEFGLTYDQTDGVFKEQPSQFKDYQSAAAGAYLTPRQIMIHMGAAYRRVDPDFWAKKLFEQIRSTPQAQLGTYVVPDVRFENELEWMKRHNALLVRLERAVELTGDPINDPSEMELDDYRGWDIHVPESKNVNLDDLYIVADRIYAHVLQA